MKKPSEAYVEKAKLLTEEETERLMARMRTKLMRRLEDKKMTVPEVVAIQMEIEDEELIEWRKKIAEIRNAEERKKSKGK